MTAVVAVLAVVVAVVLPPIVGGVARSFLDDLDTGIPIGQWMELDVAFDDWDSGWFSSTATLSLDAATPTPVLVILRHGPVIYGTPSGLGWASIELVLDHSVREFYEEIGVYGAITDWPEEVTVHLGVLLGVGGRPTIGLDVPEFASDLEGVRVDFRGLEAKASLDSESIDFVGDFGGLRAIQGQGRYREGIEAGRIRLTTNAYKGFRDSALWLGGARINSSGFTIWDAGQTIEVEDLGLRIDTGINRGDVFDAAVSGQVSRLRFDRLAIGDLIAEFRLQYDADSLDRLVRLVESARETGSGPGIESLFGTAVTAGTLLRERLAVGIDRFSFRHENRSASARLVAEFRGDELPSFIDINRLDQLDRLIRNPTQLPLSANFDMAFHQDLPRGLVSASGLADAEGLAQLDAAIRNLARENVFEARGDSYTLRVQFNNGALDINGDRVDPSYFIERVLGMALAGLF